MVEKRFNLDHFYTAFPQNYFDSLKQLTNMCKNIKHIITNNGLNSYEGLYISTKDGHYIELLNRSNDSDSSRRNFIAVNTFLSPLKGESTLHALMKEKLLWKTTAQASKVPNNGSFEGEDIGKDWFYAWYVDNEKAHEENTSIWIIDYQNQKFNRAFHPIRSEMEPDFKQVLKVKWSLHSKGFDVMKTEGKWCTNEYKLTGDSLLLSFNDPNGKDVEIEFIKDNDRKPGFKAITLEKMNKKSEFNLVNSSFFELIDKDDKITINFKEY